MKEELGKVTHTHIILMVALCLSIGAAVGLIVSIGGLFIAPIAEELGTGRGNVSITMSICNIVFAVGGMVLPKIIRIDNFKKVIFIGALMTVAGTFALSFAQTLWQLYLLNAVRGFFSGFVSTVLANMIINKWFLKNTGFVSSIAMSFSGLAGALLSPLFGNLLNTYGWRTGYQIAAGMMLVLFLPILLAKVNLEPEAVGVQPYGKKDTPEEKTVTSAGEKVSSKIWILLIVYAIIGGFNVTMIQHFPGLAEANGLAIGSLMLSAAMISNTASKMLLGALIDRFGVRKSIAGMAVFVSLGFLSLMIVSGQTYLAGAFILGFGYSVSTVGASMLTREIVGADRYASIYPTVAMFVTVSYAFGTSFVGYAYDFLGSYTPVLLCSLVLNAIIIVLVIFSSRLQKTA